MSDCCTVTVLEDGCSVVISEIGIQGPPGGGGGGGGSGTVTQVDGGAGLTGSVTTSGALAVGAGTGITVNANDVAINRTVVDTWYATAASIAGLQPLDADLTALAAAGNSAVLAATTASFLTADETKLDGIAAGATVNSSDASLRDRATHTGTQAAATISDFNSTSRAQTEAELIAGANVTITPGGSGATRTLTIASTAAGGGGGTVTSVSGTAPIQVANGTTTPVVSVDIGTTAGTVAAGNDSRITGAAQKSADLSDLASASTARTNLGLGTLATQSGTFSGTHSGASSGTNTGDQANVTGNAGTATALQTARNINGVAFDGTANITIPASVPAATETVAGIQEIATQAETDTGTVDDKFLTPLKLTSWPRVPQSFAIANLATTPVGAGEGQQIWSTVENEILTWMAGEWRGNLLDQYEYATAGSTPTWTKPTGMPGTAIARLVIIGAGGAGAGGNVNVTAGTAVAGGGGGSHGQVIIIDVPLSVLPGSVPLSIGTGGTGGGSGAAGIAGTSTVFGLGLGGDWEITAARGNIGTTTAGGPATSVQSIIFGVLFVNIAGSFHATSSANSSPSLFPFSVSSGPSGAGITTGNAPSVGGSVIYNGGIKSAAVVVKVAGGAVGAAGANFVSEMHNRVTTSGGGGGASTTGPGGAAGTSGRGCGGAGGGASRIASSGGAGAAGGAGFIGIYIYRNLP